MSGIISKRNELKKAIPSKRWSLAVDEMKDDQVQAVYLRFVRAGKIKV